ncbi:glycosyltransferase [Microaerobacter geothermalis]|uniref:tetratricopeptide repeat-containing glycosyltransferase family 2 protein n=1 Tax=Microaerobacter geothermalis TaxID=674972 RepID=UPI001F3907D5|nr:glycosyltransferase [Microaerobacter geothermalis]MCF6093304.1 glycosyltransferase [Microaerobacter geothermalis]
MSPFDISLCMVVKDEEQFLARCLESAKPYVSEIILIDTGSTDQTVSIAKEYGAKVISMNWNHHFAEARNLALSYAKSSWILVLDADEQMEDVDREKLHQLLQDSNVSGYYVKVMNYYGKQKGSNFEIDTGCRLFRNLPGIFYKGRIHEDITLSLNEQYPKKEIKHTDICVHHYGYLTEVISAKEKENRNLTLLQKTMEEEPDNLYYQYVLGTEFFQREIYDKAIFIYENILPHVSVMDGYASALLFKTVYAYKELGERKKALDLAHQGICYYPDYVDLIELRSFLLMEEGQLEEAYRELTRCLGIEDISDKYTTSSGAGTYRTRFLLGLVCERLYNWEESASHYEASLQLNISLTASYYRWLDIAFLTFPLEKILSVIYETFEEMDSELKWRSFFLYAMKWAWAKEALDVLNTMDEEHEEMIFLRSVFFAQSGNCDQAIFLLNQIIGQNPKPHYLIYRWAITSQPHHAYFNLDGLYQASQMDHTLFPIIEVLLNHSISQEINQETCKQLLYSLILVKAWDAFLHLFQHLLPYTQRKIEKEWFPGIFQAPAHIKERVVLIMKDHYQECSYEEQIFLTLLSLTLNDVKNSYQWLTDLRSKYPWRIEPIIGLSSLYSGSHSGLQYFLLVDS